MPAINVTLKKDAPKDAIESAKKQVEEQGGKVTHEFSLMPGFTAEFPEDKVHSLATNDHITVEADSEVRTQ
ncbi:hypothetical protein K458DRAFT_418355 [Lentithecium fluviatile CBS 122367]|uniref:Inhibitor I9 domain-containing protein n=1 Tax=Lentithecium fluviatile CBS 122367 TaxID=1168545 RepID=A0A6G1J0K6_9PLEO|nr:hypothetical protein K458DRAFT_418355 [Lentithecium fluviatile CBS 122367]